jgi:hypothetical protein
MAQNKTQATDASVAGYIAAITDEARRKDCTALVKLMSKATRFKPVMWGPGIVGFGSYHYKYESGREGDICLVGFSSRKANISLYVTSGSSKQQQLLDKLGKYKKAKSCLSIAKLADVDLKVLEQLVRDGAAEMKRRHE